MGYSIMVGEVLSGITAYFWLRSLASPVASFVGAVVYLFAPYHLAVDVYMRGAVAEFWIFVWLPLVLLAAQKLIRDSRRATSGLAVAFSLAVLSHPTVALCFAPIPLAYVLFFSERRDRIKNAGLLIAGLLLGVGLSAAYLLPAIMDQGKANTGYYHMEDNDQMWLVQDWNQFIDMVHYLQGVPPRDLAASSWNVAFRTRILAISLSALAIVVVLFSITRCCEDRQKLRAVAVFWVSVAFAYFFLMTNLSWLVWKVVPILKLLQFPSRLNAILVVSVAALLALAYPHLGQRRARLLTCCLASLLAGWLAINLVSFRHSFSAWGVAHPERFELYHQYMRTQIEPPEMWPRPGNDAALSSFNTENFAAFDWFVSTHPPKTAQLTTASRRAAGEVRVESWEPRRILLTVDALQDSKLTVNHFYYSGWDAHTEGMNSEMTVRPSPAGLMQFDVPKGSYRVVLELPRDPAERSGIVISLLSLLLLAGNMLWTWRSDNAAPRHSF